jgi:hypothetical protein
MTSTTWNTETERQVFQGMVDAINNLMEEELDNSSSDDSSVDFLSDVLDEISDATDDDMSLSSLLDYSLFSSDDHFSLGSIFGSADDSDSDDSSYIDHALDHVIKFGEEIFGTNAEVRRVTYREDDMTIDDLQDNSDTVLEFRFRKSDLHLLAELLWPRIKTYFRGDYNRINLPNRNYIKFETGLLMLLYRLIHPKRIRPEMENRFQCSPTRISLAIKEFAMAFHNLSLKYLGDIKLWKERIPYYTELVSQKTEGISNNVWSFIDGTMRKSCRPSRHQKIAYAYRILSPATISGLQRLQ